VLESIGFLLNLLFPSAYEFFRVSCTLDIIYCISDSSAFIYVCKLLNLSMQSNENRLKLSSIILIFPAKFSTLVRISDLNLYSLLMSNYIFWLYYSNYSILSSILLSKCLTSYFNSFSTWFFFSCTMFSTLNMSL